MNKLPYPLEREEAISFVAFLRVGNYKFFHIPNETGHSEEARRRAVRIKREGGSKGIPDYGIIVSGHLLFVELKRQKGAKPATSMEQLAWVAALNEVDNVEARVCYGAQEAIDFVVSHTDTSKRNKPLAEYEIF